MKHFLVLTLLSMLASSEALADLNSEQKAREESERASKPQRINKEAPADNSDDCTNSGTTYCHGLILRSQLEADDKALNAKYKELLTASSQDKVGKKLIRDSQRSWITFRDKTCKFVDALGDFAKITCLIVLTEERTRHLTEYRACLEQDSDEHECNY